MAVCFGVSVVLPANARHALCSGVIPAGFWQLCDSWCGVGSVIPVLTLSAFLDLSGYTSHGN